MALEERRYSVHILDQTNVNPKTKSLFVNNKVAWIENPPKFEARMNDGIRYGLGQSDISEVDSIMKAFNDLQIIP